MNNAAYWKEREEKQRQLNIAQEAEYDKRIQEIYHKMYQKIQDDINSFYVKYADKEGITLAEAKRRVANTDIEEYAAKAKQYVEQAAKDRAANHGKTDKTAAYFSDEANAEMRLYNATMKINRLELLKAHLGLEMVDGHDELSKMFGDALTKRVMDEFERQAGILSSTIQNNQRFADNIVNASFHNATFSDRIWMAQDILKYRLNEILTQALIQGLNPKNLTSRVMPLIKKEILENKRAAAQRLLRTELCRVQIDAQMKSYERNGFEKYIFLAEPTACPHCKALDDKVYTLKEMVIGENAPPIHPNCRCSTAAYAESDEEYEKWFYETTGKHSAQVKSGNQIVARYPINEDVFTSFVNPRVENGVTKQIDIIRPRSIMKNLNSTEVGKKAYGYIKDNKIQVYIYYNVDNPNNLYGYYDGIDKTIIIFADKTKTIRESALTVIHEATHARLGGKGTQKEEYLCFLEEYKHIGVELTDEVKDAIIRHIKNSDVYKDLPWE